MEKVYESKYQILYFSPEHQLTEQVWLPATEHMTEDEFKSEQMAITEAIIKLGAKKGIGDGQNFLFPVSPELQEWANQASLLPLLDTGFAKVAIIVSTELVPQLSIEQVMEEEVGAKFTTRYFGSREEAWDWLVSK